VLRVDSRAIIGAGNLAFASRRLATPGSTIKPFVLQLLLERQLVQPDVRVACRRHLSVGGKRLDCSHPEMPGSYTASEALAFSCNSYFVKAAVLLGEGELERRYRELGFTGPSGLMAREAVGTVQAARSLADRQLLAVGAAGVRVTPLQLAAAYLNLARQARSPSAESRVVFAGLRQSADIGLAQLAGSTSIQVAGKTGTASDPGDPRTHAWFAGFAPADKPEAVVVVFLERGRGSTDAAQVAGEIFRAYAASRKSASGVETMAVEAAQ
jgi:cell division protein FtsI/penicillin-binding protein 2